MHWYNTPLRKRIEALERRANPEPPPRVRVIWPDGGEVWEVNNEPVARPARLPARDSSQGKAETSRETSPKLTPLEPPKTQRPTVRRSEITKAPDPVLAAHQRKITPQTWPEGHPYAARNRLATRPCRRPRARNARDAYILPFPDIAEIGSDPEKAEPMLVAHE